MRRAGTRNGWRRAKGTTVLEQLVVLLILSAALSVASRLLVEAQARAVLEQRRILDPAVRLALLQLKADIASASNWSGDPDLGEPLVLLKPSGLSVSYVLKGDDLWRQVSAPMTERLFLPGIVNRTWRSAGPRILAIELEYEVGRIAGPKTVNGVRVWAPRGTERRTLVVTLRGGEQMVGEEGW